MQKIRMSKGITQMRLAEMLGVDRSSVAKWETGKATPRGATLLKLARVLECTVDELISEDKLPTPEDGGETEQN